METRNSNELAHYGVWGMKWGVHRGQANKAYDKASKKLNKIDTKINKYQAKAVKRRMQADKHFFGHDIYRELARDNSLKAAKQMRKAQKWYKKMEKVFANTPIKMTEKQAAIGRKYTESILERSMYTE